MRGEGEGANEGGEEGSRGKGGGVTVEEEEGVGEGGDEGGEEKERFYFYKNQNFRGNLQI